MGGCMSNRGGTKIESVTRILCLGIGGCGKTTFVRQMKVIHNVPWEAAELDRYASTIRRLFVMSQIDVISAAKKFKLNFSEETSANIEKLQELYKDRDKTSITEETLPLLKELWEDEITQKIVKEHPEMLNTVHIGYFWDSIDRIMKPDYVPTEEDILRVRIRTAGAYSTVINIERNFFEFFDVGGQKPERTKWERVLQSHEFSCVLFFVGTDEWDVIEEEKEFNYTKLAISKIIFNEVLESPDLPQDLPVVLFFNRSDLFEERIKKDDSWASFQETYPDYKGERNAKDCMNHLVEKFQEGTQKKQHQVRLYVTCALDRNAMVPIWKAVRQFVMERAVKEGVGI